jgi:hypothetical protein
MTLPINTARAGKSLAFDADGNPVVGEPIGNYRGDWASGTLYQIRDLIKDTTNDNIYYATQTHTSSGSLPIDTNADVGKWALVVDAEAAGDARVGAEAAQAAAELAASNASTSATNAASSASASATSATASATSATNSANSATASATSATNASNSATAAATSASAASTSATNAATSATNAANSATSASTSASTATTQATNAANSASAAATSATNASNSASAASTSASNAATSATNAASSATAAAASESAAEAALASFNETYLGAQASDPTLDNNGDPVTVGDWYFNTVSDRSRIYDGAAWDFVAVDTATIVSKTSSTGSAGIPSGTTGERDVSPLSGFFRFNSTLGKFEGYNGTLRGSVGGGATGGGADEVFLENGQTVTTNYTLSTNKNAVSAGPITINSGVTVTIPSGATWVIV